MGGRVSNVEGQLERMSSQLAQMDNRLNQTTTAKADQALEDLQRLKLDRKLVLDLKQGASFGPNSIVLTDQSKKDIDSFLSDLSGDMHWNDLF
jgi:C4-type Zn-finger protein